MIHYERGVIMKAHCPKCWSLYELSLERCPNCNNIPDIPVYAPPAMPQKMRESIDSPAPTVADTTKSDNAPVAPVQTERTSFKDMSITLVPKLLKPINVCALGLLIAFFLPWIKSPSDIPIFQVNFTGYNIAKIFVGLSNYASNNPDAETNQEINWRAQLVKLIYLIPLMSIATLVLGVLNKPNYFTGFMATVPVLYYVASIVPDIPQAGNNIGESFKFMAIGGYLTLLFTFCMLFFVFREIIRRYRETRTKKNDLQLDEVE